MEEKVENKKIVEEQAQTQPIQQIVPSGIPVKTIALIVVLAFIASILVYIALFPKNANLPKSQVSNEVQSPQDTTLSISNTKKAGATYYSEVSIDTGKNKVHAVQIELSFDPTQITNVTVVDGGFFNPSAELLNKVDAVNGTISYAISVPLGQSSIGGKGIVAKISYSPVSPQLTTATTLNFLPKTEVTSLETAESILKATNDGVIQIQAAPQQTSTSSAQ